jgi:hypothetical protein
MVDQTTYREWWPLHLRVARGESLNADEHAFHESVRLELEREELLENREGLRAAREADAALETDRSRLKERRRQLESEIAALETALGALTQRPDIK